MLRNRPDKNFTLKVTVPRSKVKSANDPYQAHLPFLGNIHAKLERAPSLNFIVTAQTNFYLFAKFKVTTPRSKVKRKKIVHHSTCGDKRNSY